MTSAGAPHRIATLLALLTASGCSADGRPSQSTRRAQIAVATSAGADGAEASLSANAQSVATHRWRLSFGALPVSPAALAPTPDGLLVLDNGRSVLLHARLRTPSAPLLEQVDVGSLDFPIGVRREGDLTFVWDQDGLLVLDKDLRPLRRIRAFRSVHEFVPLPGDRLLLSLFENREAEANLVVTGSNLVAIRSWGLPASERGPRRGLAGLVRLTPCGSSIVGALEYEATLLFIDPTLFNMTLRQVPSGRGLGDGTKLITGIACSTTAIIVVLREGSGVRIAELELDGSMRRLLTIADAPDMALDSLVVVESAMGTRLFSVGREVAGDRVLVAVDVPPHSRGL